MHSCKLSGNTFPTLLCIWREEWGSWSRWIYENLWEGAALGEEHFNGKRWPVSWIFVGKILVTASYSEGQNPSTSPKTSSTWMWTSSTYHRQKPSFRLNHFQHWLGRWRWHWEKASSYFGKYNRTQKIQQWHFFKHTTIHLRFFSPSSVQKRDTNLPKSVWIISGIGLTRWICERWFNMLLSPVLPRPNRKVLSDGWFTLTSNYLL